MEKKPKIFIAIPCYDAVKIETAVSLFKLAWSLTKGGLEMVIKTVKSPNIPISRNYLSSVFLASDCDYLLFIDSDVEFEPEAVIRMLVAKKHVVVTPYRTRTEDVRDKSYAVGLKNQDKVDVLPGDLIEIKAGPTGLMLIHRGVFETIMEKHPELKIKNGMNVSAPEDFKYYYNFFDLSFKDGLIKSSDVAFCNLAVRNEFKIYANIKSVTAHHGDYAWKGSFEEMLKGAHHEKDTNGKN